MDLGHNNLEKVWEEEENVAEKRELREEPAAKSGLNRGENRGVSREVNRGVNRGVKENDKYINTTLYIYL